MVYVYLLEQISKKFTKHYLKTQSIFANRKEKPSHQLVPEKRIIKINRRLKLQQLRSPADKNVYASRSPASCASSSAREISAYPRLYSG